jgi:hypothetical protein
MCATKVNVMLDSSKSSFGSLRDVMEFCGRHGVANQIVRPAPGELCGQVFLERGIRMVVRPAPAGGFVFEVPGTDAAGRFREEVQLLDLLLGRGAVELD